MLTLHQLGTHLPVILKYEHYSNVLLLIPLISFVTSFVKQSNMLLHTIIRLRQVRLHPLRRSVTSTAKPSQQRRANLNIESISMSASSCRRFSTTTRAQSPSGGSTTTPPVKQISVQDLQELLEVSKADPCVQFIDVREDWEVQTASIPGFKIFPLSRFSEWAPRVHEDIGEIDTPVVVLCHHGMRSNQAAHFLASQGYENVSNIMGGIDAYSRLVNSHVPQY